MKSKKTPISTSELGAFDAACGAVLGLSTAATAEHCKEPLR